MRTYLCESAPVLTRYQNRVSPGSQLGRQLTRQRVPDHVGVLVQAGIGRVIGVVMGVDDVFDVLTQPILDEVTHVARLVREVKGIDEDDTIFRQNSGAGYLRVATAGEDINVVGNTLALRLHTNQLGWVSGS